MESDALFVLAYSDEDLMSTHEGSVTAFKPPTQANEPPTRANEPPTRANEPPTGVFEPHSEPNEPSKDDGNQSIGTNVPPNGGDLCDPDSQHPSWEPKAGFATCLQKKKKKRKK